MLSQQSRTEMSDPEQEYRRQVADATKGLTGDAYVLALRGVPLPEEMGDPASRWPSLFKMMMKDRK
jgi:hypothetical protein